MIKFLKKNTLSQYNKKEKANVEFVDMMLQRRKIIDDNNFLDLSEYNKKLKFEYNNIIINDNSANVELSVEKSWKYNFVTNVESGAIDEYNVKLSKRDHKWLITNIEGFANGYEDEELKSIEGKYITSIVKN